MNTALKKLLPGARRAQLLTDKQKHARREAVKGPCRLLPSRGARLRALWLRAAAPAKQSRAQPACSAGRGERPLRSHGTAEPAPPAPPYPLRTAARSAPCPPRRSRRCGAWESRASPRSPSPPPHPPAAGGRGIGIAAGVEGARRCTLPGSPPARPRGGGGCRRPSVAARPVARPRGIAGAAAGTEGRGVHVGPAPRSPHAALSRRRPAAQGPTEQRGAR